MLQRPGTREFVEQNYPELVDILYPRGQGFNQSGALAGRRRAQSIAEATGTDRQAIEDAAREQYGAADYAAEVAAATAEALEGNVEPPTPDEIEAPSTALQRNVLERARFGIGLATDEDDFEARRQAALDATNAFHDAEIERINALELSEEERQNQLEDNQLARERGIHRLIELDNTFTTQRVRNERQAQEEAERTAAMEERNAERREQEAEREAERQRRAAERAEEQARREAEREAEADQREQERAERDAERQAEREQAAGIGLLRTDVQRSQFELGFATDEADFEARRQAALDATNAFHDAEADRIDGLMLSEVELANLRQANALARERAIDRITRTENTFETQRLRDAEEEMRAAERAAEEAARLAERQREREQRNAERAEEQRLRAAEREERERTREAERAQRERQRLAERQQREEERANEQRIREEMRTQDRIDGLRDDAAENEQDRLDSLADARQSYQDRLTRIEEDGIRARQDLQRDANRSREDIEREFQEDFQEIHRQRVFGEISDEEAARQTQELGRQRLEDLRELGIRTERRQEDIGLREQRQRADFSRRVHEVKRTDNSGIRRKCPCDLRATRTAFDAARRYRNR